MQRPILAPVLGVFALIIASAALAQPPGPPGGGADPGADSGPGPRGRGFGRLFISPAGEPFRGGDGLATWFARADADHDGALTPAEFAADAKAFFDGLDADHNGVLDGFEIQAYEQKVAPEIANMGMGGMGGGMSAGRPSGGRMGRGGGGRGGGGMGRGGGMGGGMGGGRGGMRTGGEARGGAQVGAGREGAARFSLLNEPEPITGADTDIDGKVTAAEWAKATTRRFDHLDKAAAGRLTLEALRPPASKGRSATK